MMDYKVVPDEYESSVCCELFVLQYLEELKRLLQNYPSSWSLKKMQACFNIAYIY